MRTCYPILCRMYEYSHNLVPIRFALQVRERIALSGLQDGYTCADKYVHYPVLLYPYVHTSHRAGGCCDHSHAPSALRDSCPLPSPSLPYSTLAVHLTLTPPPLLLLCHPTHRAPHRSENSHPRLWRLLATAALEDMDLNMAERSFVRCA